LAKAFALCSRFGPEVTPAPSASQPACAELSERNETPNPPRSNALKVQFHAVPATRLPDPATRRRGIFVLEAQLAVPV
jgi:hypothetical protein